MLRKLYCWMLYRRYGVRVRRLNGQYWCTSAGKLLRAWTLPELRQKIVRIR